MENQNNLNRKKKEEQPFPDRDIRTLLRSALKKQSLLLENSEISPEFSMNMLESTPKPPEERPNLVDIIENFPEYYAKNMKIRYMVRKALKANENVDLTQSQRNKLWLLMSDFHQRSKDEIEYYSKIVELSQKNYPEHFLKMIELDVFRTLINPDCPESEKQELITKLRNVLNAYSIRNPYIGYCQGFNFIIADLLLAGFTEPQAFWLFIYILEVLLPLDYYSSMIGIMVDQKIFLELLRIVAPEIVDKFMIFQLDCSFFTLQWFVCLFSGIANKVVFNIIWDHFLVFGSFYLFKAGLVLIQITKEKWFHSEDFPELLLKLEESVKNFDDYKTFQTQLHTFYLNKKVIFEVSETLRTIFKKNIRDKGKKMKARHYSNNYPYGKPCFCEEKSPLCFDILEKNRMKKRAVSFFVFREGKSPDFLLEYFGEEGKKPENNQNENSESPKKEPKKEKNFEDLVIGRHHHICNGKYVKTKTKNPSILHREIEMQEMNIPEKTKSNDHFVIEKSPRLRHLMDNSSEIKENFLDKIREKFFNVFNILCVRKKTKNKDFPQKNKMESKFVPVFDFSSEFNASILNSRKTYEEGAHLWKENKKQESFDLKDYGPDDFFKEIDLQIENIEKIEELRKSRAVSFNSNFVNNYVASITNLE